MTPSLYGKERYTTGMHSCIYLISRCPGSAISHTLIGKENDHPVYYKNETLPSKSPTFLWYAASKQHYISKNPTELLKIQNSVINCKSYLLHMTQLNMFNEKTQGSSFIDHEMHCCVVQPNQAVINCNVSWWLVDLY